jgi:hypothetical protein
LDTGREELFSGYNGPAKPTASPRVVQNDPSYSGDGSFAENREMTEEERQDAEVDSIKAQIQEAQIGTEDSLDRSLQAVEEANSRFDAMFNDFESQEAHLDGAERNLSKTRTYWNASCFDHIH